MLQNVKMYFRDAGKLACISIDSADTYRDAIWAVRNRVLLEENPWFEVKAPVMAIVQK
jgi:hypothetical protein